MKILYQRDAELHEKMEGFQIPLTNSPPLHVLKEYVVKKTLEFNDKYPSLAKAIKIILIGTGSTCVVVGVCGAAAVTVAGFFTELFVTEIGCVIAVPIIAVGVVALVVGLGVVAWDFYAESYRLQITMKHLQDDIKVQQIKIVEQNNKITTMEANIADVMNKVNQLINANNSKLQ